MNSMSCNTKTGHESNEADAAHKVEHKYHDYASEEMHLSMDTTLAAGPGGDPPFPGMYIQKLMRISLNGKEQNPSSTCSL